MAKGVEKMSQRKTAKNSQARKKALEAAQQFQERESRLLQWAEEYFAIAQTSGVTALEQQIENHEQKIRELQEKIEEVSVLNEVQQAQVIQKFKQENVTHAEIAARLMLAPAAVTKLLKHDPESATADSADKSTMLSEETS